MRVLITGGTGMLGGALVRRAKADPALQVSAPTRKDYDLRDSRAVEAMFRDIPVDAVLHPAARVGGIKANMEDLAGFLTDNLSISVNVIDAAHKAGVPRLVYFGSSCMYPKDFERPLKEEDILTAPLEPTNEGYAIAKIAGSRLAGYLSRQYGVAYRAFIPCNLYGLGDNYDLERGHLVAAVIAKCVAAKRSGAKEIEIWGTGTVRREFLFVDDVADFTIRNLGKLEEMPEVLNLGAGQDFTINECYETAALITGFQGKFRHDLSKPDGMKRKLMDISKARALGWNPPTSLEQGLKIAIADYEAKHG